ncbi:MAG TPA: NAD(+)/NADH kinase [Dehalococcoidales bacterium]|nr:NAD(+)/NADH kinase [Dehalococcoidales bacterium]
MNKVGILYHPMVKAARTKADKLQEFLDSSGVSVWLCSAWETEKVEAQLNGTDLFLSVGGDGTILRTAHVAAPAKIPIIGVNLGRLGFMTELSADEAEEKLPSLLAGEGWIDERAMLEAELSATDQEPTRTFHALNDVVVARGAVARVVYVEASVNGQHLATYKADGVIVATATGSTGYSLAARGPILHPQSKDFLLTPVNPHLSPPYAMVLPSETILKLHLTTVHQATLNIDGHINLPLSDGTIITVKHSSNTVRFLRIHPESSFYGSLEQKLKGKR